MEAGTSFFWISGKQPCFTIADNAYIVIFEIQCKVFVYARCFEKLKKFPWEPSLLRIMPFPDRCGVDFGSCGRVFSTVQLNANDKKKITMAKMFGQPNGGEAVAPTKRAVVVLTRNVETQDEYEVGNRQELLSIIINAVT